MFKEIIEYFTEAQKIKNKRFDDFEKYHIECIEKLPKELKNRLAENQITPALYDDNLAKIGVYPNKYYMGFTMKDVFWWRKEFEIHSFTMKPINEIRNEVMGACLHIIDSDKIFEDDSDANELYNKLHNYITNKK